MIEALELACAHPWLTFLETWLVVWLLASCVNGLTKSVVALFKSLSGHCVSCDHDAEPEDETERAGSKPE